MKIPTTLMINREDWDVVSEPTDSRWGRASYDGHEIGINSELSPRQKFTTLCHELMHLFLFEAGAEIDEKLVNTNVEGLCNAIGNQLASFLEDNCEWQEEIDTTMREYLKEKK